MLRAVKEGNTCLMDCILKATGEHIPIVCMINDDGKGNFIFIPIARMFMENPFEILQSLIEEDAPNKG